MARFNRPVRLEPEVTQEGPVSDAAQSSGCPRAVVHELWAEDREPWKAL